MHEQKIRIAFIMLCHKNPEQINLLINKLTEFSNSDIYIHVDLKYPELRAQINKQDNVFVIPVESSRTIRWGSIDLVEATIQLIRQVRQSNKEYDYIWLLSGQDYPVLPVKVIENYLSSHLGQNFIQTILPGDKRYNWYRKLYEMAYPTWINSESFFVKCIKRLYILFTGGHSRIFSCYVRKKPFVFDFAFGSQWWVLTSEAAFEILDYSDSHPEILQYYKKSIIPDESFFQTIFMRGPYSEQRTGNLTFINWKSNRRHPEILTIKDLRLLQEKSAEFCFARKFKYPDSFELISKINNDFSNGLQRNDKDRMEFINGN